MKVFISKFVLMTVYWITERKRKDGEWGKTERKGGQKSESPPKRKI